MVEVERSEDIILEFSYQLPTYCQCLKVYVAEWQNCRFCRCSAFLTTVLVIWLSLPQFYFLLVEGYGFCRVENCFSSCLLQGLKQDESYRPNPMPHHKWIALSVNYESFLKNVLCKDIHTVCHTYRLLRVDWVGTRLPVVLNCLYRLFKIEHWKA